jgi:hypothetical protein
MPSPFPSITLQNEDKGDEDFNPAIQLFGRRFFADQTVAELLIELFLIATSAKKIGANDVSETLPLPELAQLQNWPPNEPLRYAPKVRLNLKLFSFLGASKLETRHETHMQHYQSLVKSLKRPDKLGVSTSMDPDEVLKTLENLFLGLQSVGGQRTWCAQAFLPISKSLIAAETLWNETQAERRGVQTWDDITDEFLQFFSFNKHRFLARGGELLYLQLCNALRQDPRSVRKWLDEAGVGCKPEESDTTCLHKSLQEVLGAVFDACPETVGKLATFLDSGIDAETAEKTDFTRDGNPRIASCGWCPEESWREGAIFAVELLRICQALIDPIERIELLEIACALQLLRSLCAQSARYGRNARVQADVAGPLNYTWALSDPDGRNTVTKQISRRNLNALQRMIYEALRDPAVRRNHTERDYKEADTRYGHKLFLTVAKRIGLVVPKRGAGARLILNDKLLRCMVLGTIQPGARVTYETFKKRLMAHYGLAIDAAEIARSCIWTGTAELSTLGGSTDSWLMEMLDASGMLIRLSDSFSLVVNPFGGEDIPS